VTVIGNPLVSVVSFTSNLNVFGINDGMSHRGWNLNALQYPSAVHIACTFLTVGQETKFLQDLRASVDDVKENPQKFSKGSAAIYGMAASIPDRSIVKDIVVGYLDLCMKP
jgi:sphinganine-1-phosphate aldolase